MRFLDLWRMSSSNLWKRKMRTVLTVLGVVIGTASIVVMVSLGLGLNKANMEDIEESGGLTTITVYDNSMYMDDGNGGSNERLSDDTVAEIAQIPHVDLVSPALSLNVMAKTGRYESYLWLQGMSVEALEKMNIPVGQGTLPSKDAGELQLFYGNQAVLDFYDSRTNDSYWSTGEMPNVNVMEDQIFIIFDVDAMWASQYGSDEDEIIQPPKKYIIPTCGIVEGDPETYSQFAWGVYCDIEALKTQLKRVFKNKPIPNQPTTASGKPFKELYYETIYVYVDDMNNVTEVQSAIKELGYQAESNIDWIESTKKQSGYIQAVLGGIGAVSLLVAAIGIANTMMMSIYERTKEIGIMKVLGCDLRNIQALFLLEAGFIGLIGGLIGLILSYSISFIINSVVKGMEMQMNQLSYIPPWLALVSVIFAVFVGMAAGFFPSLRAMKLSPLAAIRNE